LDLALVESVLVENGGIVKLKNEKIIMAMNSFGIKNFRNIDELKNIEFGDINIFIGPNSSGKSSLLKGLLMSSQVCKLEKSGGAIINAMLRNPDTAFGSFDGMNALSSHLVLSHRVQYNFSEFEVQFEYAFDDFGVASLFAFKIFDEKGNPIFGLNEKRVLQLSLDFFVNKTKSKLPGNLNISELNSLFGLEIRQTEQEIWRKIKSELNKGVEVMIVSHDLLQGIQMIQDYPEIMRTIFYNYKFATKIFGNQVKDCIGNDEWIEVLNESKVISFNGEFLESISKFIHSIITNVATKCHAFERNHVYLSPNRYFSYAGETRPVSALQISLAEDLRYFLKRNLDLRSSYEFYSKWLDLFEVPILKGHSNLEEDEYLFAFVRLLESNQNLQAGYGLNQLLPLILSSGLFNRSYSAEKGFIEFEGKTFENFKSQEEYDLERMDCGRSILVEEPEANLHPNFQSKLAEMICESCHLFGNTFYVETHSEYLIRKFQYLKAKGELKDLDIKIFNFRGKSDLSDYKFEFKEIQLKDDGSLSEQFYPGFFDEADSIAFQLYKLNNARFN
jgi:AAA15 family ATPase/GTPase